MSEFRLSICSDVLCTRIEASDSFWIDALMLGIIELVSRQKFDEFAIPDTPVEYLILQANLKRVKFVQKASCIAI
ncbi:hypothetical protein BpHYR1_041421 [Brachionus plicatilis]|uniref:Uncharacterized protein n=1 Tax=Brachionus plicatilis TaxID=10195 RepID=A0A3M7PK12_BRAPC|nr:hypothetical protein BpHYR1_041421 [Brachionus plicatilis]